MSEEAVNKVLTQYVIENANLKITIEKLKQELEEAKNSSDENKKDEE